MKSHAIYLLALDDGKHCFRRGFDPHTMFESYQAAFLSNHDLTLDSGPQCYLYYLGFKAGLAAAALARVRLKDYPRKTLRHP